MVDWVAKSRQAAKLLSSAVIAILLLSPAWAGRCRLLLSRLSATSPEPRSAGPIFAAAIRANATSAGSSPSMSWRPRKR